MATIGVPTPKGVIEVAFTKEDSKVKVQLTVPVGTKGSLCMPLYGLTQKEVKLTVDGIVQQGREEGDGVKAGSYLCVDELSTKATGEVITAIVLKM